MSLHAISPIDGRYADKTAALVPFFSEGALIRYRILVEIEYFIALCEQKLPQLNDFPKERYNDLRAIYQIFTTDEVLEIKGIEKVTNHDVKAVEYYIKKVFDKLLLKGYKEFIHFGLTSQDINNTAIPLSIKEAMEQVYYPSLEQLTEKLTLLAEDWADVPLLARTHGQPASPTRLGKELQVFVVRIKEQLRLLKQVPFAAKFGGATGNYNAQLILK